ncbi:MAG: hypothetical protein KatS3mg103_1246 [Phycisphaerales bacterium]|nr:MAG: hypothetical protein KatS3mg103_1246 [Phycisphaerales bacterium]
MAVELVLVTAEGPQRSFSISRPRIIGREEDCDLRIPVAEVSREHCRIEPTDGGLAVEDLGSSNGTFVNGVQIEEAQMAPGDVLKIGPALLVLRVNGQPETIDPQEVIRRGTPDPAAKAPASGGSAPASKQVGQGSLLDEDEDLFSDFDFDDDEDDAPKL